MTQLYYIIMLRILNKENVKKRTFFFLVTREASSIEEIRGTDDKHGTESYQ